MYGWSKGLKTGMYYLRTKTKAKTQQFTLDPTISRNLQNSSKTDSIKHNTSNVSIREDRIDVSEVVEEEGCLSCGA